MQRTALLALLTIVLAAAELPVVATVPVVADLVRQVAGDRAAVTVLMPPGVDAHSWAPTPADAQRLATARLVVANGLGLEPWLRGAVAASGAKAPVVEAAAGIAVRPGHDHEDGHGHEAADPHAFHDVRNAQHYLRAIRDGLCAADPAGAGIYQARADLALARLGVLDAWVRRQIAAVPAARRVLVTPHAGLGYFAAAYGLELQATSVGGEAEARHVAGLVKLLRERGIPAVFRESGHADGVLAAVAREAGAALAGPLAGDGPGPGQGYDDMIAANALAIAAALK